MPAADLAAADAVQNRKRLAGGAEDRVTGERSIATAIDQLEAIDPSLPRSLAALEGVPDALLAATISAYRFGTRMLLNSMDLLEEGEDEDGRLRVSERGKKLIATCSERYPEGDTDVAAARAAARSQLAHAGDTGRIKVK